MERAWLAALVKVGIAPADAANDLDVAVSVADIAEQSEAAGNPAVPLVAALRGGLPSSAATWVHQGLTSQDAMDSALMLCARDAATAFTSEFQDLITRYAWGTI